MSKYVVLGAGGVGRSTAQHLAVAGYDVVLGTRSGTDLGIDGVKPAIVDVRDGAALTALLQGAAGVVNAVNPAYHRWPQEWPPMAASILQAAKDANADLLTISNLYGYGPVNVPMTPDLPLRATSVKGQVRAQMWADALAAHDEGHVRVCEVRASDYFGLGASMSLLNSQVIASVVRGRAVRPFTGSVDMPHSWTFLNDIGALTAALVADERSWGRAWHVPSSPAVTIREVAKDVAELVGRQAPDVAPMSKVIQFLARVAPVVRELDEMSYQFTSPFFMDATESTETFGINPTPWPEALEQTIAAIRQH